MSKEEWGNQGNQVCEGMGHTAKRISIGSAPFLKKRLKKCTTYGFETLNDADFSIDSGMCKNMVRLGLEKMHLIGSNRQK